LLLNKIIYISILCFCYQFSFAQRAKSKTLFIIDSIPLLQDPQPWNSITGDDIADYFVVTHPDSIKKLGWGQLDSITYIFTKPYRLRPDSIKKIPSLKHMVLKKGEWHLNGNIYSGKYINYFNNGSIWDEGTLWNGKLNGKVTIYFKNGNIKSISDYNYGVLDGEVNEYYKNGVLNTRTWYKDGIGDDIREGFFLNGQVEHEFRPKKNTSYDTVIVYYSTGKIKDIQLFQNRMSIWKKNGEEMKKLKKYFQNYPLSGDLKNATLSFYKMVSIDSTQIETQFAEALILARQFRFDDAIVRLDKILSIEPLMQQALLARGLLRFRKYNLAGVNIYSKDFKETPPNLENLLALNLDVQQQICNDLLLADALDKHDFYVKYHASEPILDYCRKT
jgi:hypothetical protein